MPNLRVQNLGSSLKVLFVDNTELVKDRRFTYLTEDVVSSGTTIRVQSIIGFESLSTASGQIVLIGELGAERSEILRTSNSTALSSTYKEVTLRDSMNFDHPQDTKVTIVDFNRVEFDYATSATGTKTTIAAYPVAIQADQKETFFRDTTEPTNRLGQAIVFYFARFNDSIDSRNSSWTDPVYGTGFDDNMVASIKRRALEDLNETVDGNVITNKFLDDSLWEARREYHQSAGKRPFRRKNNAILGTALTGSYRIELPTDVEKPWTAENVYGVRLGTKANMDYIDKKEWDFYFVDVAHSTLDVPYTKGTSTSIWLANGRDFSDSAVITVEGTSIGLTRLTGSNNSFRIYSHGNWSASAGSDAWENASYGLPDKFTVFADPDGSAFIYFNRLIETAYINQNIYSDYYRTLVSKDSDADVLDEPSYDMYVDYLKAKIKHRKSKGENDITKDPDFVLWQVKMSKALAKEYTGAQINIGPNVDHLPLPD